MSRRRSRLITDAKVLIAVHPMLAQAHDHWTAIGYALTSSRVWQCRDGSWTARLVWRNRGDVVGTVAITLHGLGSRMARAVTS